MQGEETASFVGSYALGHTMRISGNIVDVIHGRIYAGTIQTCNGTISAITEEKGKYGLFIIPGFVDSHIHIESSMVMPSEFARIATTHGTVAAVSDPHEIANVLGMEGVNMLVNSGARAPFTFAFGAPSCVPASPFETAGASLGFLEIESLLARDDIGFLSEVMNVPAVLRNDPEMIAKIRSAQKHEKAIDGHAPALTGDDLAEYARAGISTDHETCTHKEGMERLSLGLKLLIREGSAARNFGALAPLIADYPDYCMFCSDDKHPDDLVKGHINELVKQAVADGIDMMKVLQCACVNPVRHYGLPVGLLQVGDRADFLIVDNLRDFTVLETYVGGTLVAKHGATLLPGKTISAVNQFRAEEKRVADFSVKPLGPRVRVIEASDGHLTTGSSIASAGKVQGNLVSDPGRDILKITVVNRYIDCPPALAFVRGFGLKRGAIASSVAHDSHNIVAVGAEDEAICRAVNLIVKHKGGVAVVDGGREEILPLPIGGIISNDDGFLVARRYRELDGLAKCLGSPLRAPFMTLSFMALPVIPKLKLTDKGLFDGDRQSFTSLFVD